MINQKFKKHNGKMFEAKLSDFVILARTNKIRIEIHRYLVGKGIPTRMKGFIAFKYGENKVSKFLDSFLKNNGLGKELKLGDLVEKLGSYVREELWENNESEVVYRVLLNVSSDFLKELPSAKIENFVEYVNSKARNYKFPKITNAVNIKTSHLVKGEQFPFVFISTSHQNHFPLDYKEREMKVPPKYLQYKLEKCPSCQSPVKYGSSNIRCSGTAKHDIEKVLHDKEERRLYYVALTRAMYELFITYSKKDMDENEQKRSDFLNDLEYCTDKKNISYQNECEDEENSVNQDG
jgi:superfamily I DNA/RNA helicase